MHYELLVSHRGSPSALTFNESPIYVLDSCIR